MSLNESLPVTSWLLEINVIQREHMRSKVHRVLSCLHYLFVSVDTERSNNPEIKVDTSTEEKNFRNILRIRRLAIRPKKADINEETRL